MNENARINYTKGTIDGRPVGAGEQYRKKVYDRSVTVKTKDSDTPRVYTNCRCSVDGNWVKITFDNNTATFIPRDNILGVSIVPMTTYQEMEDVREKAFQEAMQAYMTTKREGRYAWNEGEPAEDNENE